MTKRNPDFSELIHDVRSRGSSIQEAAELLEKASPAERREMLMLMEEQARELAAGIAKYANGLRARESPAR